MTHLDLCSGIGGFSLALKLTGRRFQTIGYVEIERYCREVLRARIQDGILDDAPIFTDVRDFPAESYRGKVDCLTAGFPCQPFSVAGKQQGEADERNLWPDIARIIRQVAPATVFLENVPTLLQRYAGRVFGDLAALGYRVRWDCIPASAVGANHRRDRLWILAYANNCRGREDQQPRELWTEGAIESPRNKGRTRQTEDKQEQTGREDVADAARERIAGTGTTGPLGRVEPTNSGQNVADAERVRQLQSQRSKPYERGWSGDGGSSEEWWAVEPDVCRTSDGVPERLDRC